MVCPLCGYTATLRAQMERHLALHNQMQDKVRHKQTAASFDNCNAIFFLTVMIKLTLVLEILP